MLLIVGASRHLFDDAVGQTATARGGHAIKEGAGARPSRRISGRSEGRPTCTLLPTSACSPRTRRVNGETRPATWTRGHVDSMSQDPESLSNYEEANSETLAPLRIEAGGSIEDFRVF